MARRRALSSKEVDALRADGTHWLADGLYLQVRTDLGNRSYLARYYKDGRNFWLGLGAARDVPLAEAKELAADVRRAVRRGGAHPVVERKAARAANSNKVETTAPTFDRCAELYIAAHCAGWRNEKHGAQWESTLRTYASPMIGKRPVDQVTVEDVLKILQSVWTSKPETASRLRGRIEQVLGYAAAKGYRTGVNPAAWKGAPLEHLLPPINRVRKVEQRAAVPVAEMAALWTQLQGLPSASSRALRFTIACAARTGETIGATWDEVDLAAKTWTVPAERMKGGVEHVVPLTDEAIALLGPAEPSGFLFTSKRRGKPLSNAAMLQCLRGLRDDDATVHGTARASFRTWAGDAGHPREVAEAALAHAVGNAVEAAYQRSTYLARRRELMQAWSNFLVGRAT